MIFAATRNAVLAAGKKKQSLLDGREQNGTHTHTYTHKHTHTVTHTHTQTYRRLGRLSESLQHGEGRPGNRQHRPHRHTHTHTHTHSLTHSHMCATDNTYAHTRIHTHIELRRSGRQSESRRRRQGSSDVVTATADVSATFWRV